jgi:hypothetical protein
MEGKGFTTRQAAELGEIPYPTMSFLRVEDVLRPSICEGGERGVLSRYSLEDVIALRCMSRLRRVPGAFNTLKAVAKFWQSAEGAALAQSGTDQILIVTETKAALESPEVTLREVILAHGSRVLHVVDVGEVVTDVRATVSENWLAEHAPPPRGRPPRRRRARDAADTARSQDAEGRTSNEAPRKRATVQRRARDASSTLKNTGKRRKR